MAYKLRKSDEEILICEGASVVGDVTLSKGVSVWYNATLRGDEGAIVVGENTNIQDGAVLHEETHVGAGCTIGHNAIVHGCTVGDGTMIGMGACVLNGAVIGKGCLIGAGALIKEGQVIPDGSLCVGVPAKVVRELDDAGKEKILANAALYVSLAAEYKEEC